MNFVPELKNWRTTLSATFAVVVAVIVFIEAQFDNDPSTIPDANGVFVLLLAAINAWQGLFSRDARVSSQESGIRPEKK